jgi:hypothetical protein
MLYTTVVSLLLPICLFAAPFGLLDIRNASVAAPGHEICAPTSYTVSDYEYLHSNGMLSYPVDYSHLELNFAFQSHFSDASIIDDTAIRGVDCHYEGSMKSLMNNLLMEIECGEGRLVTILKEPEETAECFFVYTWWCNGCVFFIVPYAPVTDAKGAGRIGCHRPYQIITLNCAITPSGLSICKGPARTFKPNAVHHTCSTHQNCWPGERRAE